MRLPGGHTGADGRLLREARFRTLDGHVELAVARAAARPSKVDAVSAALSAALGDLDGVPVDTALADSLCVGDRNALMLELACLAGYRTAWITATCARCDTPFDFEIDHAAMPVEEAPEGYPFACVALSDGRDIRVRVPTGSDQRDMGAPETLAATLAGDPAAHFSEADLAALDAAIAALMPGPPLEAAMPCPECGTENRVPLDMAGWLEDFDSRPLDDVHDIARAYHWSEADILALPRSRRLEYLARIHAGSGREA